jgi:hypothetical protein
MANTITLADYRAAVRGKLQDSTYDSTLIDNALNYFVNDLFMNHHTRLMESNAILTPQLNATTVDLPDDFQTMIKEGAWVTVPQVYQLVQYFMEYGDFMKTYPGWLTYPSHYLTNWTFFGNKIRFAAPLSAATTINMDYLRQPVDMVSDNDLCEVPDLYQEMVVLGGLARCMQTNEDYDEASQEFANLNILRTAFIRNESRGGGGQHTGPTIIRTNRRGTNVRERNW